MKPIAICVAKGRLTADGIAGAVQGNAGVSGLRGAVATASSGVHGSGTAKLVVGSSAIGGQGSVTIMDTGIRASVTGVVAAERGALSPRASGRAFEAERRAARGLTDNPNLWRPSQADIGSAAFNVIVGKPKYTPGGQPVGTIFDSTQGGFLEIKGGSSVLGSSYQLRLQSYRSLKTNIPYTIDTTRPINPSFKAWLDRWGVNVADPPK